MTTDSLSIENSKPNALRPISGQTYAGFTVVALSLLTAYFISRTNGDVAAIWVLANLFGLTLQRARFCFASAFRDLFLFGSGHNMKGIIIGMGIATIGFSAIMHWIIPNPAAGFLPAEAHILPVGLSVVVGGVLFGVGMVIAGGCVSGSLYRMAEGYVASWVAIIGVIIGLGALTLTWTWWWAFSISNEPKVWLPSIWNLGYTGAIVLTLLGLLAIYLLVTFMEYKNGLFTPQIKKKMVIAMNFDERVRTTLDPIFKRGWPIAIGGVVLGIIGIVMYTIHMPLGVTGELMRASQLGLGWMGVDVPVLDGLSTLGGCTGRSGEPGLLGHTFAITVGLLPGALIGALFAGEFKIRLPKQKRRYVQSITGGVMMGYASGLAVGCTIGAFFSAVPSLSLSGWVFGLAMAAGAFTGTQVIKRIG
ncbi:MAG: YeeE/YedE family protein [Chloroflexi bacterium]|nr:YeeE/YedE family protein [Chloroflexota bacterium]